MNEKLAATGKLAASLAHEINNPLAAVANLLFLIDLQSREVEVKKLVNMATAELDRVTQITRHTLSFYQPAESAVEVDVKQVVEEVVRLYQPQAEAAKIRLCVTSRDGQCGRLLGFPRELQEAVGKLMVNAMESQPGGGEVMVRVGPAKDRRAMEAGVSISVADRGEGIPVMLQGRVFEPFFSTKRTKGAGLGLWVSLQIVRKHGGKIRMRSRPGAGSCFTIFLPAW